MFIKSLLFLALVRASPAPQPDKNQSYDNTSYLRYSYRLEDEKIVERGVFATAVPGFDELKKDQYRYNNYEQFLDYLISQAPSLKKHPILLHHSASLQIASPEHPRILLFDGGKVFSFAEDPENRIRRVEILEASEKDYSLRLSEIAFTQDGIRFDSQPKACTACHGFPAKPLWDPYDFWPNAYGSSIGRFSVKQEEEAYDRLRLARSTSPLLQRIRFPKKLNLYQESSSAFTFFINQINFARWMTTELKHREFNGFQYALFSTLSVCSGQGGTPVEEQRDRFLEFFRPEEREEIKARFEELYTDIQFAREHKTRFQDWLLTQYFPNPQYTDRIDHRRLEDERTQVAFLRLMMDLGGIQAANLSASHIGNDYLISNPTFFPVDFLTVLYEIRPDWFADLTVGSEQLGTGKSGWVKLDCEELKQKSLAANRPALATPSWRSFRVIQPDRPVLSRCSKCHSERLHPYAPYIPFHDSREMAKRFRDPQNKLAAEIRRRINLRGQPGQMPPGNELTDREIEAVQAYIKALE